MLWQRLYQPIRFSFLQEADATLRFREHADFWNLHDPTPIVTRQIKHTPNDFESPIDGRIGHTVPLLSILDKRSQGILADFPETISTEIRIKLQQVQFVVRETSLVNVVFQVTNNRVLPVVLSRYPGSGGLIGFNLKANQILFSVL
jgi:hypothetical protein